MPSSQRHAHSHRSIAYIDATVKELFSGDYRLNYLKKIGSGYSSIVSKCSYTPSGCNREVVLAVKSMLKEKTSCCMANREIELLRKCQDKNVVQFDNAVECRDAYVIVTEYCSRGDLYSNLKTLFRMDLVREYMMGIVRGLESLHNRLVAHCDIKMRNILISDNNVVKIADFGFAIQLRSVNDKISDLNGTDDYWGPEMRLTPTRFNPLKSDVYALAVTFVGILERKAIKRKHDNINQIVRGYQDIQLRQMLQGMLENNPELRLTMTQVKNCEWFNDMSPPPSPT